MGKERMALERLNNGYNAIMATNPQVIPLSHIVSENHP
jgi:hypothetical protein